MSRSGGKKGGKKGGGGNLNLRRARTELRGLAEEALTQFSRFSQIGQQTPFGSLSFEGAIGSPDRRQVIRLSPERQAQLESTQRIQGGLLGVGEGQVPFIADQFADPLSFDDLSPVLGGQDLLSSAAELEGATFDRGRSLLQPGFDRQRTNLETQLANQGIPRGTAAYNEAFDRLERSQGEQLERLAQSSVAAGRAEQSRLFGVGTQRRQQEIGELLTQRGQPLAELAALLGQAPAPQSPQFPQIASQSVPVPSVAGLRQAQLGEAALAQQGKQQKQEGITSVASIAALAAFSDERLKKDKEVVGILPVYDYRYTFESDDAPKHRGFMAQDVEGVIPEAVLEIGGVKVVRGDKLAISEAGS